MNDSHESPQAAAAGAAVYNKMVLGIYDLYVLGFSNRFVWRCPSARILDFYNEHVAACHLDVGVGTGYFLDKCRFPVPDPAITLVDLNPNSLQATARRIRRYSPQVHVANALEPLPLQPAAFDSIALNHLLHCLPGDTLFGTTILGRGAPQNVLARRLMSVYNAKGIFGNTNDTAAELERVLGHHFDRVSVRVTGCVAFFVGQT